MSSMQCLYTFHVVFFFKQKTAYDMRISDWSSDVCSSDLLIVTGVARYNSIGDYLLGTVVDHIVRRAQAPVLVGRRRPAHPYRRIVVATDLSDCSRAALLSAARLFPGADFTLVHAFHEIGRAHV